MKTIILGKKFSSCKYGFRETCFGICEKEGKILLTKNNRKNEISMVGGGIEPGETYENCLRREFLEESGYTVESVKKFCTIDCYWLAGGKWPMESLANFYIVTISEKISEPTEEGYNALWVSIKEAEQYLPLPYHKKAIIEYLKQRK